jgi:hypothetical protein
VTEGHWWFGWTLVLGSYVGQVEETRVPGIFDCQVKDLSGARGTLAWQLSGTVAEAHASVASALKTGGLPPPPDVATI